MLFLDFENETMLINVTNLKIRRHRELAYFLWAFLPIHEIERTVAVENLQKDISRNVPMHNFEFTTPEIPLWSKFSWVFGSLQQSAHSHWELPTHDYESQISGNIVNLISSRISAFHAVGGARPLCVCLNTNYLIQMYLTQQFINLSKERHFLSPTPQLDWQRCQSVGSEQW